MEYENKMNIYITLKKILSDLGSQGKFLRYIATIIKISPEKRMDIYEDLAEYLDCGVPINRAILNLRDGYLKESKTDITAVALNEVAYRLRNGMNPSKALSPYIPSTEALSITAGDSAGKLVDTLMRLSKSIERNKKIKHEAIMGSITPVFGVITSISSLYFMGLEIIPKFESVMPPEYWSGVPKSLYIASQFIQSPWSLIPVVLIALVIFLIGFTMKSWTGRVRVYADLVPPWSFYRIVNGGNWLVSLSLMSKSGANTIQSLKQMDSIADPWLSERLNKVIYQMENGVSLGKSLEMAGHNFPDKKIVRKLSLLSELPNFDKNLEQTGTRFIEKGERMVKTQSFMFNSFIFAIVGLMAFWFVIGIVDLQIQVGDFYRSKSGI